MVETWMYWYKSPSNILLKKYSEISITKYLSEKSVLDAGAGKLAYRSLLKKYVGNYTSSDFKKTHKDLDVVTDIEKTSFKNNEFDGVFCSQVLEHVPHPWLALKEMKRITKKNGFIIITVPMLGYIHNAPFDFFRYTKFGLESLAKDSGLKVAELKEVGGLFCFLGYIRSTILMPLFLIPVLGLIIYLFNLLLSLFDILMDKIFKNSSIFPLNYLMILEKVK